MSDNNKKTNLLNLIKEDKSVINNYLTHVEVTDSISDVKSLINHVADKNAIKESIKKLNQIINS